MQKSRGAGGATRGRRGLGPVTKYLQGNAYHEAGHAIAGWSLDLNVVAIAIRDDRPGDNTQMTGVERLPLVDQLAVWLAGREAEIVFGHPLPEDASAADRVAVINLLLANGIAEQDIWTCAQRKAGYERARQLLSAHRHLVERLATRLIDVRRMDRDAFAKLMNAIDA
jgi:ATP-dependent Zn protease